MSSLAIQSTLLEIRPQNFQALKVWRREGNLPIKRLHDRFWSPWGSRCKIPRCMGWFVAWILSSRPCDLLLVDVFDVLSWTGRGWIFDWRRTHAMAIRGFWRLDAHSLTCFDDPPGILRFQWQVLGFVDSCGKAQWQRWPRSVAYPVCPKGPDDPVIARRLQLLKAGRGTKGFLGHHVPCPCDEANKAKKRQPSTMVLGWVTCIHALSHWMARKILAVLNTISASPLFWEVVHCGIEMVLSNMSCQEALFSYWLNWCGAWFLPCCLTNLDATSVNLIQLSSAAAKPGKTATMNSGRQHLQVVTQTLLPGPSASENYWFPIVSHDVSMHGH